MPTQVRGIDRVRDLVTGTAHILPSWSKPDGRTPVPRTDLRRRARQLGLLHFGMPVAGSARTRARGDYSKPGHGLDAHASGVVGVSTGRGRLRPGCWRTARRDARPPATAGRGLAGRWGARSVTTSTGVTPALRADRAAPAHLHRRRQRDRQGDRPGHPLPARVDRRARRCRR